MECRGLEQVRRGANGARLFACVCRRLRHNAEIHTTVTLRHIAFVTSFGRVCGPKPNLFSNHHHLPPPAPLLLVVIALFDSHCQVPLYYSRCIHTSSATPSLEHHHASSPVLAENLPSRYQPTQRLP